MLIKLNLFKKIYIYISDVRLRTKRRQKRENYSDDYKHRQWWYENVRKPVKERANECCEFCGINVRTKGQIHHILPYSLFPKLLNDTNNMLFLCKRCHNEVHNNPYLNIQLMENKAKEYNINIKKYYKTL